jgi:hypothetical protein
MYNILEFFNGSFKYPPTSSTYITVMNVKRRWGKTVRVYLNFSPQIIGVTPLYRKQIKLFSSLYPTHLLLIPVKEKQQAQH